jgi:hypothetical protein
MADATMEYNLQQAKDQMDRLEQQWQQMQGLAQQNLADMATMRAMLVALSQQVGVDVSPPVATESPAPVEATPAETPAPTRSTASPATVTTEPKPEPATTSTRGSSGGSGSSSRGRSGGSE